uniref:Uncharacterized protein n=1 Tax=Arundo donax TaxID=35708 RepID=A0A0A8Z543_ARUDO
MKRLGQNISTDFLVAMNLHR